MTAQGLSTHLLLAIEAHLDLLRGVWRELELLLLDGDIEDDLHLQHSCPRPLACVHLPQQHPEGVRVRSLAQPPCRQQLRRHCRAERTGPLSIEEETLASHRVHRMQAGHFEVFSASMPA